MYRTFMGTPQVLRLKFLGNFALERLQPGMPWQGTGVGRDTVTGAGKDNTATDSRDRDRGRYGDGGLVNVKARLLADLGRCLYLLVEGAPGGGSIAAVDPWVLCLGSPDIGLGPAHGWVADGDLPNAEPGASLGLMLELPPTPLRGDRVAPRWARGPAAGQAAVAAARLDSLLRVRAGTALPARNGRFPRAARAAAALAAAGPEDGYLRGAEGDLAAVIGFGSGLTPSGDDFIAGLVAARVRGSGGEESALWGRLVKRLVSRTVTISRFLLLPAAEGLLPEAADDLWWSLVGGDAAGQVTEALNRLLAVGASSGADLAWGMLAGLRSFTPAGWVLR